MNYTLSGTELIQQYPDLAKSVFARNDLTEDKAKKLNFLLVEDYVNIPTAFFNEKHRIITGVIVFDKPVTSMPVASGFSIKSPEDEMNLNIGISIAASRAIRDLTNHR